MLVHYKIPNGVFCIDGIKIYGRYTNMPPEDISYELYLKCKNVIEHATYRETHLQRMFKKKKFPMVAFNYKEIKFLPDIILDKIGSLIVRRYKTDWSHHRKVNVIKGILRRTKCP